MIPQLRRWLVTGGSVVLAVRSGWLVAHGAYLLPALAGIIALAAILVRLTRLSADVILLGLLLIGYIVGNRGFAQLMPLPGLPLFPAEFGLAVGLGWVLTQAALRRTLPWRGDFLNWALLLWLILGTARVVVDVRRYGLFAIRDYATIYYTAFFFLAQHYGVQPRARRYLIGCVLVAVIALLPVYFLFSEFPLFFFIHLTVQGVPLVYLKGDLAYTFLAAGSLIIFHAVRGPHRFWGWPLATLMFLTIATGDSRASFVGAVVAMVWLALARRWAYPAVQAAAAPIVLMTVAMLAYSGNAPLLWPGLKVCAIAWCRLPMSATPCPMTAKTTPTRATTTVPPAPWRSVLQDTWAQGPVFGLGFGYDLAANFLQIYEPGSTEEFAARSPHSIIIGTFGRMGTVGLAALLLIVAAMMRQTWRALRDGRRIRC